MKYKDSTEIWDKWKSMLENFNDNINVVDSPEHDVPGLTKWIGELLFLNKVKPGVKISNPDERLFFYQAENNGRPVLFFSNQNRDKSVSFEAEFDSDGLNAWKWDAETGEKSLFSANKKSYNIQLKPLESLLLVFSDESGEMSTEKEFHTGEEVSLNENWTVDFIPVEGEIFTKEIPVLGDLAKMPGTEAFGGTLIYKKTFDVKNVTILKLGKVAETAEVTLNGKNLGVKYWGERIFDVSDVIIEGENEIEIKVTTLLWNYCNSKTMGENPMAKFWADRNRIKDNKPLPTGLIGPVKLS